MAIAHLGLPCKHKKWTDEDLERMKRERLAKLERDRFLKEHGLK
jgi:hypothetical protein